MKEKSCDRIVTGSLPGETKILDEEKKMGNPSVQDPLFKKSVQKSGGRGRKRESPSASLVERPLFLRGLSAKSFFPHSPATNLAR